MNNTELRWQALSIAEEIVNLSIGKVVYRHVYVHSSALDHLRTISLSTLRGVHDHLEEDDVVFRLHKSMTELSLLHYPTFIQTAHPSLCCSRSIALRTGDVSVRSFAKSDNPPILHRKELFVAETHPMSAIFRRLTRQEEEAGLYEHPQTIGRKQAWDQLLYHKGLEIVGHELKRRTTHDRPHENGD